MDAKTKKSKNSSGAPPNAIKNRNRKKNFFIAMMLLFPMLHFLVFFVYININTIALSFQRLNFVNGETMFVGLLNFKDMFTEIKNGPFLKKAIFNSLMLIPVTNFILLPISLLASYILYKKVFMHKVYRVLFFLPSIISVVVMTMAFAFMFDSTFGVFNDFLKAIGLESLQRTWFGDSQTAMPMVYLYNIWVGVGFNVVLFNGAISRIPEEVIEYGQMEGISMTREFGQIVVPMIWPTITTVFVMGSSSAFTLFLQPKLLTGGGPNGASATIAFHIVEKTKNGQFYSAAPLGVFFGIVGIIVVMTFKRILEKVGTSVEY